MAKKRIYLDNCVTTQPAPEVIEAMMPYWQEKFWFPANFVSTGEEINSDLASFKETIASSIHANPNEVHFTLGGTAANNLAIKGILTANADKGTHIICSVVDYPDILTNAAFFEQSGFDVTYLGADSEGFIDLDELREAIRPDTVMVMTTWVNHVIGTIQPVEQIVEILKQADHRIYLHVDAGQAYGKFPIDVQQIGIDSMAISAHKIHGPQGVGALYLRSGVKLIPTHHGVNRVDNLQTGGISIASLAGFAKAIELTFNDLNKTTSYLRELSDYLLEKLESTIPFVELNGPRGEKRVCHNINTSLDFIEGEAITMMLDLQGVTVATGSACASQGLKPNYVLMAIGKNHVQSHGSLKFTVSRYTTKEDIDYTVAALAEIAEELRSRSPLYHAPKA